MSKPQINMAFEDCGHHPKWPKLAYAVIEALGLMQHRSQSHPHRIAGYLTVPQLAEALGIPPHWVYDQSKRGTVVLQRDAPTRLFRLPARPETLGAFGQ